LTGKLADALERYEKADRLTGDPVKEISQARGRVRVRLEREKKLEEQMRKASPAASTAPSPLTSRSLDGEKGQPMQLAVKVPRANLREQPSMTARVLQTLTQGTLLEKLEELVDWVKVRVPDGTVGWMSASLVSRGRGQVAGHLHC